MPAEVFALFERIHGTAIRAFALASAGHVQKNPGVVAVNRHVSFGAGAIHAALGVKVRRQQLNVR